METRGTQAWPKLEMYQQQEISQLGGAVKCLRSIG